MTFAYKTTKLTLDLATKLIKSDVRLHNAEAVKPDMAVIFAANHFTRIETFLLPHQLIKHTGRMIGSLAAGNLFQGRAGSFLRSVGTISTKDPDRDRTIIRSLLTGEQSWVIFPEGSMIKDKKLVNSVGEYEVFHESGRRKPFTGAGMLALQAEFYRQTMRALKRQGAEEELAPLMARFDISDLAGVDKFRTVIVPVNITFFPIRSQENIFLSLAQRINDKLSPREIEELSVEGTILAKETDIDITLGEAIEIRDYLGGDDFEGAMSPIGLEDTQKLNDPKSRLALAAQELMRRYMTAIYNQTTINFDHIFATLIHAQKVPRFTERAYRNRIFLSALKIAELGKYRLHTILRDAYRDIIYEDPSQKFQNFIELCLKEGILRKEGRWYLKNFEKDKSKVETREEFHSARSTVLTQVIANEIEPLEDVTGIIRHYATLPRPELSKTIRSIFVKEDKQLFVHDYAKHKNEVESKSPDVGAPFLYTPEGKIKAGIVLAHGYLAAPLETRLMAEFFQARGYAVYGVRLRGHGTSPEDLAQTKWADWYESFNRGYTIIKSLTDDIILGGFSTGGDLALMAAGKKGKKIRAVFAINSPLHLRNYAAHLVPTMARVNTFIAKVSGRKTPWQYVENHPENTHINYTRNPVAAIRQLSECIAATEAELPKIVRPTLILQGSRDPIVDPISGQLIFSQVGTPLKEYLMIERNRHGIINGEGAEDVCERVLQFIERVISKSGKNEDPNDED